MLTIPLPLAAAVLKGLQPEAIAALLAELPEDLAEGSSTTGSTSPGPPSLRRRATGRPGSFSAAAARARPAPASSGCAAGSRLALARSGTSLRRRLTFAPSWSKAERHP